MSARLLGVNSLQAQTGLHALKQPWTTRSPIFTQSYNHAYSTHRYNSTAPSKSHPPSPSPSPSPSPKQHDPNALPSFNLFKLLRDANSWTRYTVYAGLGLMATVESTFWFNVMKAKFFPSKMQGEAEKSEEFLERIKEAVTGYRMAYLGNYGRYYGGYVWGVGER